MMTDDDRLCVRRCLAGDRSAFDILYDRHERRVLGLLRRLTGDEAEALDLAQETFLAAYRTLAAWRGGGAFGTWLCGIAVRQYASHRRGAGRHATEPLDEETPLPSLEGDPLACCTRGEALRRIEAAVSALPPHYREVFVLVKIEGCSYREAAEGLGIPVGTVQSRLWRAVCLLQVALRDLVEEREERPAPAPARAR
jgi:RNA polymerase sigma-70 factor (ECF subfamily)